MNFSSIFLFESEFASSLYPFSIMHCGWELRTGFFRNFEKIKAIFPDKRIIYSGRDKHLNSFLKRYNCDSQSIIKENLLVLNSAIVPNSAFFDELTAKYRQFENNQNISKSALFVHQGTPLAAYLSLEDIINPGELDKVFLPKILSEYNRLIPNIEIDKPDIINFLWESLDLVGKSIEDDFKLLDDSYYCPQNGNGIFIINENKVKIGQQTIIMPGVVIDASDGPVIIGNHVKIMPNSVIFGPCSIGDNSLIKVGAKVYGNTAIGEYCKIGGEIENTIIHSYSNKQHEGFLGHSYICEWVNLGADTNTSDLKNTYSNIKVNFFRQEIETGRMFLGLLCGDHTKSAINTSFTTGTVVGIAGIIVADGFLPNYIPSFAWRGIKGCTQYKLDKAIETARIVMNRRNKILTDEEIELMQIEYSEFKSSL
jgi:UDP-N-acetylglucosamine diphosphorylase/glucosamine-1-phosphate N-acetyltransferase